MKNILENLVKAVLSIVVWDIIDIISKNSISIKQNIIGFIVFFVVWTIIDYIKNKINK